MILLNRFFACTMLISFVTGCATHPPRNLNNVCKIFKEKSGWYKQAKRTETKYKTPVAVTMAILHQESRFQAKAKQPRSRILWFIPGPRRSSAYGYAQVLDPTWEWYQNKTGNSGARRHDFADVVDFIGWYNNISHRKDGIAYNDAYHMYLAYHEGHGGFKKHTYNKKPWLKKVASKVAHRASSYQTQLNRCEHELKRLGWFWWLLG